MSISLTYFEVSWRFCASKICLFCRRINDVINSFTVSVAGGADGGVSSDICGMVAEPVVQTAAGRRTHKTTKLAANLVVVMARFGALMTNLRNLPSLCDRSSLGSGCRRTSDIPL